MDSDILNIEDIVMGRSMPDPPPTVSPPKPAFKPVALNGPPVSTVTPYQHENLQCFQCFITFCSAKAKERHMKKSHREEYKQVLQQGNTLFTCYVCDRTFMSSEELTQHQPTHSKDDKPFKCVHCKESFKTFSELTVHRRQLCPERQFPCKDCNENFRSAAMLRTHRLALHPRTEETEQHEDGKNPMCKKCGQSFDSETDLIAHTEKHPEGQPCNGAAHNKKRARTIKTEDTTAAEKKGKRKKKEDGEESEELEAGSTAEEKGKSSGTKRGRPSKGAAKMDADDKSSVEEDQANKKKPKAEPAPPLQIPCTECDLTFPGLVQLRAHKKEKHTQKKAHPCEECEESFARPEQLDVHMTRVHADGRFSCSTCGKSFGRERSLKAHEKTHEKANTDEENQATKR